jgi:hypothetical protein
MKFRIMTEKSIVGFGRYTNNRIEQLIGNERLLDVVMMYFGLSHISFREDVLEKLKITEEWRIEKPGINKDLGYKFISETYPELCEKREVRNASRIYRNAKRDIRSNLNVSFNAARSTWKNQGH